MGGALAGMFAAREVGQFLAGSVKAFAEAEAGWNRLASTVDATGASFTALRPRIEAAADAMMEASRFGDDEFAAALQSLTIQTGDVEDALGMMGLAADLAAAKQLSLESAAETLGRGLAGNTTQLTRMFPALKGSTDLFGDLQKIVAGMAEKDVAGLEGQLVQLNTAWGEFKEEIGEALTAAVNGPSIIDMLTEAIRGLTTWIGQNQGTIQKFADSIVWMARDLALAVDNIKSVYEWAVKANAAIDKLLGRDTSYLGTGAGGTWSAAGGGRSSGAPPMPRVSPSAAEAAVAAASGVLERLKEDFDDLQGDLADLFLRNREELRGSNRVGPERAFGQQAMQRLRSGIGGPPDLGMKAAPPSLTKGMIQDNIPEAPGFLSEMFGGLKSQVVGLASAFGPLAAAVAVFKPIFEGVMAALGPALTALMVPLKNFGFLIGSVITPVLELLTPVLEIVSMAFAKVIQGIGWLIRGVGDLLNKLPGSIGNPLKKFGQEMIDAAKAAGKHTDTTLEATEALVSMTSSMSNVPSVFANALRRFQSSTTGVGIPPPAALVVASATGTAGSQHGGQSLAFNGPITVIANNPEEFARQMEDYGAKVEWRAGYSRFAIAVG